MKTYQITLTEKQAKNIVTDQRRYLIEDGGLDPSELKDLSVEACLGYCVYNHTNMVGREINAEFTRVSKSLRTKP